MREASTYRLIFGRDLLELLGVGQLSSSLHLLFQLSDLCSVVCLDVFVQLFQSTNALLQILLMMAFVSQTLNFNLECLNCVFRLDEQKIALFEVDLLILKHEF